MWQVNKGIKNMIVDVQKHLETGEVDENGDFSAEVTYKVITYYNDGVGILLDKDTVSSKGLPCLGDKYVPTDPKVDLKKEVGDGQFVYLKVTNITIDVAQDSKFTNNGHFNVPKDQALLQWDYVVSYSFGEPEEDDGSSSSSSSSSNNSNSSPSTMAVSAITYDIYDARMYKKGDKSMKNPTDICRNAIGEPMYGIRKLRNLLIKFSYYSRKFEYDWITKYTGTVNANKIVICGIEIEKGGGILKSLQADYDETRKRKKYKIDAEIEIAVMRPVDIEKILGTSYKANMDIGRTQITDYVQFEGNPYLREQYKTQNYTFIDGSGNEVTKKRSELFPCDIGDYKKGWGNWGSDMYQLRISEPIVLSSDGYIYDKTQAPDWDDPDLNVIDKRIAIELDWKSLDFPRKWFRTYQSI